MDFLRQLLRDTHLKVESMCYSLPSWTRRWEDGLVVFGYQMSEPRPIRRLHEELINKIAAGEVCLFKIIYLTRLRRRKDHS